MDFIPLVSENLQAPRHLEPLIEVLERARTEPVRVVVNIPPQHGKSETILHWFPWLLLQDPYLHIAYVSYAIEFSKKQNHKARQYAKSCGLVVDKAYDSKEEWLTPQGGGVYATGVGGPLTGRPVKILVVDDPIKNREEAESSTIRNTVYDWFNDVAMTRLHPDSSAILVQTRWHVDDISGRLINQGWENLCIPATDEDGEALWPEHRPKEFLAKQREQIGDYAWYSMYQGVPRPRGGALFGPPTFCNAVPAFGRVGIGIDLAYTAKTHSDYSVVVQMREAKNGNQYYIEDVKRQQVLSPEFGKTLKLVTDRYPGVKPWWYCSGVERGAADHLISNERIPIEAKVVSVDKFIRAQAVSAAWNAGKIIVPNNAPWLHALIDEVLSFTGVNDPHDDIVDALAAAYDSLAQTAGQKGLESCNSYAMKNLKDSY